MKQERLEDNRNMEMLEKKHVVSQYLENDIDRDFELNPMSIISNLEKLKEMCIAKAEPYAEKKARRRMESHREELATLRDVTVEKFWTDYGFVKYTDSRGAIHWLPPDQYEGRMHHRKRRRAPTYQYVFERRGRIVAVNLGMVVLAVLLGVLLAR